IKSYAMNPGMYGADVALSACKPQYIGRILDACQDYVKDQAVDFAKKLTLYGCKPSAVQSLVEGCLLAYAESHRSDVNVPKLAMGVIGGATTVIAPIVKMITADNSRKHNMIYKWGTKHLEYLEKYSKHLRKAPELEGEALTHIENAFREGLNVNSRFFPPREESSKKERDTYNQIVEYFCSHAPEHNLSRGQALKTYDKFAAWARELEQAARNVDFANQTQVDGLVSKHNKTIHKAKEFLQAEYRRVHEREEKMGFYIPEVLQAVGGAIFIGALFFE
ncbi:MAG: hypothetical protein OXT67_12170, partial [Zetaproteobacteria bacterium]|nr:hypothetical protein [Zetaproteobacteria bacterium]